MASDVQCSHLPLYIHSERQFVKTSTQTLLLHNSTTENVLEIMQLRSLSLPRAHVQGVK